MVMVCGKRALWRQQYSSELIDPRQEDIQAASNPQEPERTQKSLQKSSISKDSEGRLVSVRTET